MGFGQFAFPSWRARALQRIPLQVRAHWSSWADCLEMVKSRHLPIAAFILDALDNHHPGHHFTGARTAREHLQEAHFDVPSWEALANGLRPDAEDSVSEPRVPRHGWQCKAMRPVNERFLEGVVQPRLLDASRALLRSQSGPFASLPFTSFPSALYARSAPSRSAYFLLRRLWLPLPLPGHHRAACSVAGDLGSRGFALESAAARVCREAGGRVSANVRVQDMDLAASNPLDNRRIEVVVDGLRSSMVSNSPWTRHWSLHCAEMGPRTLDAPTWMVQPWTQQGVAKRPRTLSSMGAMAAPDWLSGRRSGRQVV